MVCAGGCVSIYETIYNNKNTQLKNQFKKNNKNSHDNIDLEYIIKERKNSNIKENIILFC